MGRFRCLNWKVEFPGGDVFPRRALLDAAVLAERRPPGRSSARQGAQVVSHHWTRERARRRGGWRRRWLVRGDGGRILKHLPQKCSILSSFYWSKKRNLSRWQCVRGLFQTTFKKCTLQPDWVFVYDSLVDNTWLQSGLFMEKLYAITIPNAAQGGDLWTVI